MNCSQAPLSTGLPGKNTGMGCHFLLQGIFPTQGLNLHRLSLLHWQAGSLPLSQLGSPDTLVTLLQKFKSILSLSFSQFSSVAQSCLTLCDPVNLSTPGLPVHHQLPEFTQTLLEGK